MDNSYYFNDLKINIQIENNNKQIKYFKELLDVNNTCKYEVPVLNWDGYKKYDDKITKLNEIIITLVNKNYNLRKKLINKPNLIKPKIYTLQDYKKEIINSSNSL